MKKPPCRYDVQFKNLSINEVLRLVWVVQASARGDFGSAPIWCGKVGQKTGRLAKAEEQRIWQQHEAARGRRLPKA